MGLGREAQLDFSAGEQRDVAPHLIDPRGFYLGENTLLLDDGSAMKRGGSQSVSNAPFGSALRYIWDGFLQPGRRTLLASTSAFGTLAADGKDPISLGGGGFPGVPKLARAIQGMLFIPGGKIWGGSRTTAEYSAGTVKVTQGSRVVIGVGTAWLAKVDEGMLFRVAAGGQRVYVVSSVRSDTEIELRDAYEAGTEEGIAYTLKPLEDATAPYKTSDLYAVSGRRLLAVQGQEVWFSEPDKPHVYEAVIQPLGTVVTNRHVLADGVEPISIEAIGIDRALIFHTGGITGLTNLALPIVDPNGNDLHRIDIVSREIVLWGAAGITGYSGSLIVPATDDVYLIDGTSDPKPLSESISPLYREHVSEGRAPGAAWVDRNHYFLPILDAGGTPVDLLCCRMDRPVRSRGRVLYPWSYMSGAGAKVAAGFRRQPSKVGETPRTYAAAGDGRLLDVSAFFTPTAANKNDHDGTTPNWALITRDYEAGNLAIARFRRVELLYDLEEAIEGEVDGISCEIGTGIRRTGLPQWDEIAWDEFEWAEGQELEFDLLETFAPPNAGPDAALAQNAWVWGLNTRARYCRFRFQCADPVAKLTLRGVAPFVAQPEGVRLTKVR